MSVLAAISAFVLLQPRGAVQYIQRHFFNTDFKGIYRANGFDLAILIPYFIVLILLASYGMHRYALVWMYYRNRKNKTTEPASRFADDQLPRITVQLPIFNEQFVVDRLIEAVCRLQYPKNKLQIQVLDDSTDETVTVAGNTVERYAALGHNISYHHRTNRYGF